MPEQRYLLTVGYQAGRDARITKGADGARDFFSPEELEKAAWSLLLSGAPEIGIYHQDGTTGHAQVVESYVYRGPDWAMDAVDGSQVVIKSGDWLVGVLCDDLAWQLFKSGRVGGISPQGKASRRTVRPNA